MHRRPGPVALAALAALTVATGSLAACGTADDNPLARAETSTTAPSTSSSATTSTTAGEPAFTPKPIAWHGCGGGECATVEVPLDYAAPSGERIVIDVRRSPAHGERIGALFVNPGGPGGSAADYAAGVADYWPSELARRFDIVGVEPRGVGRSSRLSCTTSFEAFARVDPSPENAADQQALARAVDEYARGCQAGAARLLPHVGTRNVARDMDAVRAAMGDDTITYVGMSYGTVIGQVYADLFPNRVRAMVLDGVGAIAPPGVETAIVQAEGFERALKSFVASCNGDRSCPLAPDAMGAVEDVFALAERNPTATRGRVGPDDVALGITYGLYSQTLWPSLSDAIDDARDGRAASMESLAADFLRLVSNFDIYAAVSCVDAAWPDDPSEMMATAKAARSRAPHFAEPVVNGSYLQCAGWPVDEQPLEATDAAGAPPIVVISTTNDPATPYEAGVDLADHLQQGVLVTYEGEGHTVYGNGVGCVDDPVTRYLVELTPPRDGLVC